MQRYIGTKIVHAQPAPSAAGNSDGYLVVYPDGYKSWSPKAAFEEAYRPTDGLSFGLALEALKKGMKVARAGWNGKDMWLSLSGVGATVRNVPAHSFWSGNNADYAKAQPDRHARVLPCITMKTADGCILMGWLASQTDMLSEDWVIVE